MFPDVLGWLRTAGIAALAAGIVGMLAYAKGSADGRAYERAQSLNRSVEVLRERNATDDRFQSMSDADLCLFLGGMPDDDTGECL